MPNYSVKNCLNDNNIIVVSFNKGQLNPNDIILSSNDCYSVINETDQKPQQPANFAGYSNCLECYQNNGIYFIFVDCKSEIQTNYYISSNDFKVLPVLNKIYYMSIDGGGTLCYQFTGISQEAAPSTLTSEIVEYNKCEDCVVKPTFGELYSERINDGNYTQKTNDFKNNYSNFINEREGQQPK